MLTDFEALAKPRSRPWTTKTPPDAWPLDGWQGRRASPWAILHHEKWRFHDQQLGFWPWEIPQFMEVSFGKIIEPKYWDVQLPRFWLDFDHHKRYVFFESSQPKILWDLGFNDLTMNKLGFNHQKGWKKYGIVNQPNWGYPKYRYSDIPIISAWFCIKINIWGLPTAW